MTLGFINKLSNQQLEAATLVKDWYLTKDGSQSFYLAGYAGTGKSTIVKHFANSLNLREVVYCAFTGKAASILASKGNRPSSTVHSLIYNSEIDDQTQKVTFSLKSKIENNPSLIVLDECSMVNEALYEDILSYGIKVLILGDPGQLPPITGTSPFGKANYTLTEVHRQSKGSNILKAATQVRLGLGALDCVASDYELIKAPMFQKMIVLEAFMKRIAPLEYQVICGRNATRVALNQLYRRTYGFLTRLPAQGEKIICLKNNREYGLFNGQMFTMVSHGLMDNEALDQVAENKLSSIDCEIQDDSGKIRMVQIDLRFFLNDSLMPQSSPSSPFTYAYAITCHKSQGSQWDNLIVVDESSCFKELKDKWLYTAITRAAKRIWIIK